MATNSDWTVVFEDKLIIKSDFDNGNGTKGRGYSIDDDSFWNQSKFSNIWAIQYGTSNPEDAVEYRNDTPHSEYDASVLGDFQQFIDKWDAAHLAYIESMESMESTE